MPPIPSPRNGQSQKDFIAKCMGDSNMQEYDQKQRAAICFQKYKDKSKKASYIMDVGGDQYLYFDEPTES